MSRRDHLRRLHGDDAGSVLALLLAAVAGVLLAGLSSVALVNATSRGTTPVTAPLVTYDAG
jgi:hypothetical protein